MKRLIFEHGKFTAIAKVPFARRTSLKPDARVAGVAEDSLCYKT
jgi:hypothetical protein